MNSTIEINHNAKTYDLPAKTPEVKRGEPQTSNFFTKMEQFAKAKAEMAKISMGDLNTAFTTEQVLATGVPQIESSSLESMLKAKYPNLVYHVFDASTSAWRTRNDYPHELMFQQGSHVAKAMENWTPSGANPQFNWFTGVPPASKAVIIHPDAQARMDSDPEFAKEVMARIEEWWAYDVARNEEICPGCTVTMSQGIAIGADGSIVNVVSGGASLTPNFSQSSDEFVVQYKERIERRDLYMKLLQERKMEQSVQDSYQLWRRWRSGILPK